MEEPLLGSSCQKPLNCLCITEDPPCTSCMQSIPTPSSIKERLIFGSPAALPDSLLLYTALSAYSPDPFCDCLLSDPSGAHYCEYAPPLQSRQLWQGEQAVLVNGDGECNNTDDRSTSESLPSTSDDGCYVAYEKRTAMESPISSPTDPSKLFVRHRHKELEEFMPGIEGKAGALGAKHLFRSRTAPALFGTYPHSFQKVDFNVAAPPSSSSPMSIVSQAFIGLMLYLSVGMVIYTLTGQEFSGPTTNGFFDALYFCIVTMCTIGYGDITPVTPVAKLFSCAFVLVGFGFIDILLSAMVSYVLQRQETLLLNSVAAGPQETAKNYLVDVKKGRMRIRSKVFLAFGVLVICIGIGTFMMCYLESLGWLDAFYLSCMSVTTVGYGDHAFKTLWGRVFASVWLLVSTLAVAQSFLYLAEARIDKRHRLIAKWVLEKEMTLADLLAADLDNDGSVSKSDFVVYKLKEMRKIDEKDITEICRQFSRLDPENSGKITLSCLLNLHKASSAQK